jgi:hypothetical protein
MQERKPHKKCVECQADFVPSDRRGLRISCDDCYEAHALKVKRRSWKAKCERRKRANAERTKSRVRACEICGITFHPRRECDSTCGKRDCTKRLDRKRHPEANRRRLRRHKSKLRERRIADKCPTFCRVCGSLFFPTNTLNVICPAAECKRRNQINWHREWSKGNPEKVREWQKAAAMRDPVSHKKRRKVASAKYNAKANVRQRVIARQRLKRRGRFLLRLHLGIGVLNERLASIERQSDQPVEG